MDTTVRNLDEEAYRALKARSALNRRTIGELMSEAIRAFLGRPDPSARRGSLRDLTPEPYPPGCEKLSQEIDRLAYGLKRSK